MTGLTFQLGIGSIGTLVSHHLRLAKPDAPISLIVKSARGFPSTRLYPQGRTDSQAIKLSVTRGGQTATTDRFDQEAYNPRQQPVSEDPDGPHGPIRSLVVCLKTPATLSALSKLKHRLQPDSVVALLQNGMGVYDELCAKIWPEPATRPFFLLGTTTHGVTSSGTRGQVIHMSREGEGEIKWGLVPDPRKEVDLEQWVYGKRVSDASILTPPESPSLPLPPPPPQSTTATTDLSNLQQTLSALLSLAPLNSTLLPMPHLHHTLLLKLALNANINPLTAIIGAGSLPNGALLASSPSHRLIRMLSAETSAVITAYLSNLHAPHSVPADTLRLYTREAIITRTLALCHATARNTSSMAADASSGRMTEIDHINGYLVSLGERLRVPTPHHQMVCEMVKFTAEVTGLQSETAEQRHNSNRLARGHANEQSRHTSRERKEVIDERRLRAQWLEERRASRRARRQQRKELAAADGKPAPAPFDPSLAGFSPRVTRQITRAQRKKSQLVQEAPTPDVVAGNNEESAAKAMLAQLDALSSPDTLSDERSTSAARSETASAPTAKKPMREEGKPVDDTEEQEEDEAIKAIENRILGGFSRSGRRGF